MSSFADINFLGVKNCLPPNCFTGQVQVSFIMCSGALPIRVNLARQKREVLVEKHKNTGKLLMPVDLRSVCWFLYHIQVRIESNVPALCLSSLGNPSDSQAF